MIITQNIIFKESKISTKREVVDQVGFINGQFKQ